MRGYRPQILPFGQLGYIIIVFAVLGLALLLFPRKRRVLLGAAIFLVAWQGGIWVQFIQMDIRPFHLLSFALLAWNLAEGKFSFQKMRKQLSPLWPWILLIVWSLISTTVAIDAESARQGPARFIVDVLFFMAVLTTVKTPRDFRFLIMCIAAALIGQSILALIQFKFIGFTVGVIDEVRTYMWWRAKGTYRHPNHLGMTYVILLPIVIRGIITALGSKDKKLLYVCTAATLLGGIGILTTYNRGAWVAFVVGMSVMLSLDLIGSNIRIKRFARALILAGMIIGAVGMIEFGDFIMTRMFASDQEEILEGRERLQEEGFEVMMAHPVFGVGYANEQLYARVSFVHNVYILIGSETGLIGLGLFMLFLFKYGRLIIRGCRSKIVYIKNFAHGLVASLVGFMVASIPGPDFWINDGVQIYFWTSVALMVILIQMEQQALAHARREKAMKREQMQKQEQQAVPKIQPNY